MGTSPGCSACPVVTHSLPLILWPWFSWQEENRGKETSGQGGVIALLRPVLPESPRESWQDPSTLLAGQGLGGYKPLHARYSLEGE